jgi:hypothetical protein
MSPRERSVFEASLRPSRHSPATLDRLTRTYKQFTPAQRAVLDVATEYRLDDFNRSIRRGNGKPESSHTQGALDIGWRAMQPVMNTAEGRALALLPSVGILAHDHPENFMREEMQEELSRFKQGLQAQNLFERNDTKRKLSVAEMDARVEEKKDELKRTYLPHIRNRHVASVWNELFGEFERIALRNRTTPDELFATKDSGNVGYRMLDLVTPFVMSNSVLVNSYADRARTATQIPRNANTRERAMSRRAVLHFFTIKANDRTHNTDTMYAATRDLKRAVAVERLEKTLAAMLEGTPLQYRRRQEQAQTEVFRVLDQARSRNLKTGDSFAQNINDFKNTILFTTALKYLQNTDEDQPIPARVLAQVTGSFEKLLAATVFHAKQHTYSLVVHGIREPMQPRPGTAYRYHTLGPEEFSYKHALSRLEAFKRTEGWNRLDGDDGTDAFSEFKQILAVDHQAEQSGRDDSQSYAYNIHQYFTNAAYYWHRSEDWLNQLKPFNEQLFEHIRTRGAVARPSLRAIPALEGSLSYLAE